MGLSLGMYQTVRLKQDLSEACSGTVFPVVDRYWAKVPEALEAVRRLAPRRLRYAADMDMLYAQLFEREDQVRSYYAGDGKQLLDLYPKRQLMEMQVHVYKAALVIYVAEGLGQPMGSWADVRRMVWD
jgi:hypothetical protein